MTTTTTPSSPATTSNPADPDVLLQQLRSQLAQGQATQDQQTRNNTSLKTDITALEGGVNAIKQVVAAYTQASASLARDQKELLEYYETKKTVAQALVGNKAKAIDQSVVQCDAARDSKAKEKEKAEKGKKDAEPGYRQAKDDQTARQVAFDGSKDMGNRLAQKLNDAKSLKSQIDAAEKQNQPATMYFLLQLLNDVLSGIKVISPDELKANVAKAWYDLNDSAAAVRDKTAAWESAKDNYDVVSRELDDLTKKRQANITALISQYNDSTQAVTAPAPQAR